MSLIDTLAGLPLISPFIEFGFMRRALAGCLALSLGAMLGIAPDLGL